MKARADLTQLREVIHTVLLHVVDVPGDGEAEVKGGVGGVILTVVGLGQSLGNKECHHDAGDKHEDGGDDGLHHPQGERLVGGEAWATEAVTLQKPHILLLDITGRSLVF